ncbi:unnamed protein product [Linum trigynum]|uniref:Uncharacterized protein n=1 Tax=Linum trigynum TaxID=586398 RepID=A0AAV2G6R4_9ROSI
MAIDANEGWQSTPTRDVEDEGVGGGCDDEFGQIRREGSAKSGGEIGDVEDGGGGLVRGWRWRGREGRCGVREVVERFVGCSGAPSLISVRNRQPTVSQKPRISTPTPTPRQISRFLVR